MVFSIGNHESNYGSDSFMTEASFKQLEESLVEQSSEASLLKQTFDFKKVEVVYVCKAPIGQQESCLRYMYHTLGCTFRGERGECGAS